MSEEELLAFTATDGWPLRGHLVEPDEDSGDVAVILHPATGVNLHLYRKFAQYIADEHHWPVLVYDLRGSGESARPQDDRDRNLRMSDWILKDVPGATGYLKRAYPGRKYVAIGHSVGAHGMFATQQDEPVDVMVQVASHAGITRLIRTWQERAKIWTVFNIITPLTARVLGRVPVEQLGLGKQIPVGVMTQWARWTRRDDYFFGDAEFDIQDRFNAARGPVLSVVFTDDLWANRTAVDVLTDQLTSAEVEKLDIDAGPNSPNGPIGHMGFYRSKNAGLWPQVLEWVHKELG